MTILKEYHEDLHVFCERQALHDLMLEDELNYPREWVIELLIHELSDDAIHETLYEKMGWR